MDNSKTGWLQLIHWCQQVNDEKQLTELFDLLLTPEEKKAISLRCLIIRELLLKQQSQRDIAQSLHVSIAKITRGSNEIKRTKRSLIQYIENHLF